MVHPAPRPPWSWRSDPAVPDFDDVGPIAVVDGSCALCTASARLIGRLDRAGDIRICPTDTAIGTALLRHYGLDPADPDSWLYVEDGCAYGALDGMMRIGRRTGGIGRVFVVLRLMPRGLRDRLYRLVARNRIRWFGRADICAVPDPALRRRLMG